MKERVDEPRRHGDEFWHLGFEEIIVILVIAAGELEILLDLYVSMLKSNAADLFLDREVLIPHLVFSVWSRQR